jgi:hypothetical protein
MARFGTKLAWFEQAKKHKIVEIPMPQARPRRTQHQALSMGQWLKIALHAIGTRSNHALVERIVQQRRCRNFPNSHPVTRQIRTLLHQSLCNQPRKLSVHHLMIKSSIRDQALSLLGSVPCYLS